MKKILLSAILLATLSYAEEAVYAEGLSILTDDAKVLNTMAMESLQKIATSDEALEEYSQKVEALSQELGELLKSTNSEFASKDDALVAMDKIENISSQAVVLAKTITYLSSHQGDNVSDSYETTLKSVSKTVLRLSDDIGVMADRILDMADKIGVMADRIVTTQEIQSRNLGATTQLIAMSMNLSSRELQSMKSGGVQSSDSIQNSSRGSMQSAGQATQVSNAVSSFR